MNYYEKIKLNKRVKYDLSTLDEIGVRVIFKLIDKDENKNHWTNIDLDVINTHPILIYDFTEKCWYLTPNEIVDAITLFENL